MELGLDIHTQAVQKPGHDREMLSRLWAALPAHLLLADTKTGTKRPQIDGETQQQFQAAEAWMCYNDHFARWWEPNLRIFRDTGEGVLTQRGCSNYNPPAIFCFLRTSGNGGVCVLTPESTTQNPAVSARKSSKSATRILSFTSKERNWKHWVLKLQVQLLPK